MKSMIEERRLVLSVLRLEPRRNVDPWGSLPMMLVCLQGEGMPASVAALELSCGVMALAHEHGQPHILRPAPAFSIGSAFGSTFGSTRLRIFLRCTEMIRNEIIVSSRLNDCINRHTMNGITEGLVCSIPGPSTRKMSMQALLAISKESTRMGTLWFWLSRADQKPHSRMDAKAILPRAARKKSACRVRSKMMKGSDPRSGESIGCSQRCVDASGTGESAAAIARASTSCLYTPGLITNVGSDSPPRSEPSHGKGRPSVPSKTAAMAPTAWKARARVSTEQPGDVQSPASIIVPRQSADGFWHN